MKLQTRVVRIGQAPSGRRDTLTSYPDLPVMTISNSQTRPSLSVPVHAKCRVDLLVRRLGAGRRDERDAGVLEQLALQLVVFHDEGLGVVLEVGGRREATGQHGTEPEERHRNRSGERRSDASFER